MGMKYTLTEFVDLCNMCDYICPRKNGDLEAKTLGYNLIDLKDSKEQPKYLIDDDNRTFYSSLKRRGFETEYIFLQDSRIKVRVNIFEPFICAGGKTLLDQKWHTLISWLAFLDTKHFDNVKSEVENPSDWKIESIVFDDEKKKTKILYACGDSLWFSSKGLNDWIFHAINE